MAIWLVRAGRNGEREDFALENGVAVIGWNELGDLSGVKSRDDVKALLQKVYPQFGKAKVNNNAGQIWAFRATIEKGNLVILPLKTRGTIAVGKSSGITNTLRRTRKARSILARWNGCVTIFHAHHSQRSYCTRWVHL